MKKYLFIGGLVVIAAGVGLFVWSRVQSGRTPAPSAQGAGGASGFPVASSTAVSGSVGSASGVVLSSRAGTAAIVALDFINNGTTVSDPANFGNYYLTGTSTSGFAIGYQSAEQFFTIALEEEPLGRTRLAAEDFLRRALGVSDSQLCNLKYYLGTDSHTNPVYAGKNLGFSFCPGAAALPQ